LLTDIIYSCSWRLRKRKKGLKNILLRNLLHKFVLGLFWGHLSMQVVFIWELCTLWFGPLKFKEDQINYYYYISFKLYIVGLGKNVWTAPYLYFVWNGRTLRKPRKRGRGRNLSVDSRNILYFGTFKHLLQPLRSHTRSFGTLWQLLEIPPFVRPIIA
jgi:hypothetical protein